ncbi:haloacid dehalogenase-like hydrolase [Candidatus Micrarchaeota archaeon]|nr:haloacid dehalogenase-like hydrolase [Candidatus Micrarchaeota archaeon]
MIFFFDVDGTLAEGDTIFRLFSTFGKKERAEEINRVAPSEDVELVLEEILEEQGPIPMSDFEEEGRSAKFVEDAEELVRKCGSLGEVFLLTCTYEPIAMKIAERLGVRPENVFSTLLSIRNGFVVGFKGPIMDGEQKRTTLREICGSGKKVVGLGDSAADAPFLSEISARGGLALTVKPEKKLLEAGAVAVKDLFEAKERILEFAGVLE